MIKNLEKRIYWNDISDHGILYGIPSLGKPTETFLYSKIHNLISNDKCVIVPSTYLQVMYEYMTEWNCSIIWHLFVYLGLHTSANNHNRP